MTDWKYLPVVTKTQWDKMSKVSKRLSIAEDVIARINTKIFTASTGFFIEYEKLGQGSYKAQDLFNNKECSGCARGGLFCSYIGINNDFEFFAEEGDIQISLENSVTNIEDVNGVDKYKELIDLFGKDQLYLIEAVFESHEDFDNELRPMYVHTYFKEQDKDMDELYDLVREFRLPFEGGSDLKNANVLLTTIMENIITNKGTFVL